MQIDIVSYLKAGLFITTVLACSKPDERRMPCIPAVSHAILAVDGHLEDWANLPTSFEVTDFCSPWDDTPFGSTSFRSIVDSAWLYFNFEVTDSLLVSLPFIKESDVAWGDRVEIFLSGDSTLSNYYCLEMGPYGDVLDYRAAYYRQLDDTWDLSDLSVSTQFTTNGYIVEGRIPIDFIGSLSASTSLDGYYTLWMGLYRAEYYKAHTEADPVQWITWIDPATEEPDFHVPSSFHKIKIQTLKSVEP